MQLSIVLAALTAITVSASPVAPPIAFPTEAVTFDSPGVEVKAYPNGLPKELIPHAIDESGLTKRQSQARIYACTNIYFQGSCYIVTSNWGQCVNIGNNLINQISSIGPDSGYCYFFRDYNCSSGRGYISSGNPGFNDLTQQGFNDQISSYVCYA